HAVLYPLSLHDALPISTSLIDADRIVSRLAHLDDAQRFERTPFGRRIEAGLQHQLAQHPGGFRMRNGRLHANANQTVGIIDGQRSEEHTSELQSRENLV